MKLDQSQIPIREAFEQGGECPICNLEQRTKQRLLESVFGETVMDYDFQRSLGPKNSFCREHFLELYSFNDKLGLAIMVDRILEHEKHQIKKVAEAAHGKNHRSIHRKLISSLSGKKPSIGAEHASCVICKRMTAATHNSIKIMNQLWHKHEDFRVLYAKGEGFCRKHYESILECAVSDSKHHKHARDFIEATLKLQLENTKRLHAELKWFIDKFDYQNADKPWGSSRDSLYRSVGKLVGFFDKSEELL